MALFSKLYSIPSTCHWAWHWAGVSISVGGEPTLRGYTVRPPAGCCVLSCGTVHLFFFFFFLRYWSLNSGPSLSHSTSPPFFFEIRSQELFPGLASNWEPPDLCFLSS
jgi:hypothetical protein